VDHLNEVEHDEKNRSAKEKKIDRSTSTPEAEKPEAASIDWCAS